MNSRLETVAQDVTDLIGDWSAPEGSEPWAKALRVGLQRCVDKVDLYPSELRALVDKAMKHAAWTKLADAEGQPFPTFESFCSTKRPCGLGTSYAVIKPYLVAAHGGDEVKVAALTTRPEAAPKPGGKREGAGRPLPRPEGCEPATPPADSAENHRVRPDNQVARAQHEKPSRPSHRDSEHLAARIARDAPAVHEAMKAGKYPSVRAAAKAAGIVKEPDPVRVAARAITKVPTHRLAELVAVVAEPTAKLLLVCLRDRLGGAR